MKIAVACDHAGKMSDANTTKTWTLKADGTMVVVLSCECTCGDTITLTHNFSADERNEKAKHYEWKYTFEKAESTFLAEKIEVKHEHEKDKTCNTCGYQAVASNP